MIDFCGMCHGQSMSSTGASRGFVHLKWRRIFPLCDARVWLLVDRSLSHAGLAVNRSGQCAGRAFRWAAASTPALRARPSSRSIRTGGDASTTPPRASTARAAAWPPSTCPGPPVNTSTWCALESPPCRQPCLSLHCRVTHLQITHLHWPCSVSACICSLVGLQCAGGTAHLRCFQQVCVIYNTPDRCGQPMKKPTDGTGSGFDFPLYLGV